MSNLDLKPYAERLAKAMPERFDVRVHGHLWTHMVTPEHPDSQMWAFFGPLLDEFEIRPQHLTNVIPIVGGTLPGGMLEAVCEAVCQAAEAKAREETT